MATHRSESPTPLAPTRPSFDKTRNGSIDSRRPSLESHPSPRPSLEGGQREYTPSSLGRRPTGSAPVVLEHDYLPESNLSARINYHREALSNRFDEKLVASATGIPCKPFVYQGGRSQPQPPPYSVQDHRQAPHGPRPRPPLPQPAPASLGSSGSSGQVHNDTSTRHDNNGEGEVEAEPAGEQHEPRPPATQTLNHDPASFQSHYTATMEAHERSCRVATQRGSQPAMPIPRDVTPQVTPVTPVPPCLGTLGTEESQEVEAVAALFVRAPSRAHSRARSRGPSPFPPPSEPLPPIPTLSSTTMSALSGGLPSRGPSPAPMRRPSPLPSRPSPAPDHPRGRRPREPTSRPSTPDDRRNASPGAGTFTKLMKDCKDQVVQQVASSSLKNKAKRKDKKDKKKKKKAAQSTEHDSGQEAGSEASEGQDWVTIEAEPVLASPTPVRRLEDPPPSFNPTLGKGESSNVEELVDDFGVVYYGQPRVPTSQLHHARSHVPTEGQQEKERLRQQQQQQATLGVPCVPSMTMTTTTTSTTTLVGGPGVSVQDSPEIHLAVTAFHQAMLGHKRTHENASRTDPDFQTLSLPFMMDNTDCTQCIAFKSFMSKLSNM